MNKIRLEIVGLSYSQTQSGAYALVLSETSGLRSLPIIIGAFEAQAIAIELEKMTPNRPLTHDLFKSLATAYDITLREVLIDELNEGIFHAKLVFEQNGDIQHVDARTSDAIAIAVRFKCPIYTFENIMDSAGVMMDESQDDAFDDTGETTGSQKTQESSKGFATMNMEQLQEMLNKAIEEEDYETASKIRDEINKRSQQ
ncbi:MAG: bifunctional nuclease family protein [Flavobacteriia bacterium]|nr:bifunctional nuclease family protein [Flavobacteriia bacterium]OJX36878.1 MAG: hypothetical protein BGO87_13925 [Flavobacteriia bacterium 40-80]